MEITSRVIQYGLTLWIILQCCNISSAVDCGRDITTIGDALYKWKETPSGETLSKPCRSPFNKGFINRTCDGGAWQDPVWSSCETVGEMIVVKTIHYIGCGLTIFFCFLTLVLLVCFWKFVSRYLTALVVSLCLAVIASNAVFMASAFLTGDQYYCQITAICLHYFPTVVLFALGVIIIFIAHTGSSSSCYVICALTFTWCGPITIVAAYGSVTKLAEYGNSLNCWLQLKTRLFWVYIIPFLVLIGIAGLIACLSSFNAYINRKKHRVKRRVGPISLFFVSLFTILTWTIGTISVNQYKDPTYVLQIVFVSLDIIQGILIFAIFGIRSSRLREPSYKRQKNPKTAAAKKKATAVTRPNGGMRQSSEEHLPPAHVFSTYKRFVMNRVDDWRMDNFRRMDAESNVDSDIDFYTANNHQQRHHIYEKHLIKREWRSQHRLDADEVSKTSLQKDQTDAPPNQDVTGDAVDNDVHDSTSRHVSDKGSVKSAEVPFFNFESSGIGPFPTEGDPNAASATHIDSSWEDDIAIPSDQINTTITNTTVEPPTTPEHPEPDYDVRESTTSVVEASNIYSSSIPSPPPSPPPPCLPDPGLQSEEESMVVMSRQRDESLDDGLYKNFINRESVGNGGQGSVAEDDTRQNRVSKVRFDPETNFYSDQSGSEADYDDLSVASSRKESPVPSADVSIASSSRQQISTPPSSPPHSPGTPHVRWSESRETGTQEPNITQNVPDSRMDSTPSSPSPSVLRRPKHESLLSPEPNEPTVPSRNSLLDLPPPPPPPTVSSRNSLLDLPPPPPPPPLKSHVSQAPSAEPPKPSDDDLQPANPEVSHSLPPPPPPPFVPTTTPTPSRVSFLEQPLKRSKPKHRPQNTEEPKEFYLTADFLKGRRQSLKPVKDASNYRKSSKEEPFSRVSPDYLVD